LRRRRPVCRWDRAPTCHDGMRRRIDIEADDVPQLGPELGVAGQLELAHPVRLEAVRSPDPLHRTDADADCFGHHCSRPMRRVARRIAERQRPKPLRPTLRHTRTRASRWQKPPPRTGIIGRRAGGRRLPCARPRKLRPNFRVLAACAASLNAPSRSATGGTADLHQSRGERPGRDESSHSG
jgi:hypothetical protein